MVARLNTELLKSLGATHVIDRNTPSLPPSKVSLRFPSLLSMTQSPPRKHNGWGTTCSKTADTRPPCFHVQSRKPRAEINLCTSSVVYTYLETVAGKALAKHLSGWIEVGRSNHYTYRFWQESMTVLRRVFTTSCSILKVIYKWPCTGSRDIHHRCQMNITTAYPLLRYNSRPLNFTILWGQRNSQWHLDTALKFAINHRGHN